MKMMNVSENLKKNLKFIRKTHQHEEFPQKFSMLVHLKQSVCQ